MRTVAACGPAIAGRHQRHQGAATATGMAAPAPAACDSTMLRWVARSPPRCARWRLEAGVDAVDRLPLGEDGGDRPRRDLDGVVGLGRQRAGKRRDKSRASGQDGTLRAMG